MNVNTIISDQPRLTNGFSTVSIQVPEAGVWEVLDISFEELYESFGEPDPIALDFVLIAGIVYLLDKGVRRRSTEDAWTRTFEVAFPVSSPRSWELARASLQSALRFLTGDNWEICFTDRPQQLYVPKGRHRPPSRPTSAGAVSLFSGGLDSLIGVLDYLAATDERIFLVGHHDATGAGGDQRRLHSMLEETPYAGRSDRRSMRVRPLPPSLALEGQEVSVHPDREQTLRSRSLVFLALGMYAAHALGEQVPLLIPENGFIAINIPLTPSRIGTCSTRTTHPYYLSLVREICASVGLTNPIHNPLELVTKGEALAACHDQGVLAQLALETVSCAHASRRKRWIRRHARNCGYCVPCLIRRAALHHVGWDNGEHYGIDVCTSELSLGEDVASDVRAVLSCLARVHSLLDIEERVLQTGRLPHAQLRPTIAMVGRGLDELRDWVCARGTLEMKHFARV